MNNENFLMPESEIPNPPEREKDKGKREKSGEAANRFNDLAIQRFNKSIQLFNHSTIQQNQSDSTIARFNAQK